VTWFTDGVPGNNRRPASRFSASAEAQGTIFIGSLIRILRNLCECYANRILWMAVMRIILRVWT
jgi:hypothetical protein